MAHATPGRQEMSRDPRVGQLVGTIGRLAQAVLDLRIEYERRPNADTLAQIDRRLGELLALREELQARQARPTPEA